MPKIIKPGYFIENPEELDEARVLKRLERYARTCYKSEGNITDHSAPIIIKKVIERGHESVLEHEKVTVRIICDRGVSHEIVRHRIAAYSQESTRYCNYAKGDEIVFIAPFFWSEDLDKYKVWYDSICQAEQAYLSLMANDPNPERARSVLPNSLKTEIVVTYNLREWRHFFKLRCSPKAHPQMQEITLPMFAEFKSKLPTIFFDMNF